MENNRSAFFITAIASVPIHFYKVLQLDHKKELTCGSVFYSFTLNSETFYSLTRLTRMEKKERFKKLIIILALQLVDDTRCFVQRKNTNGRLFSFALVWMHSKVY